jgi:hypothetical protein
MTVKRMKREEKEEEKWKRRRGERSIFDAGTETRRMFTGTCLD